MCHALPVCRCTRNREGGYPRQLIWTGQRDILYHRTSYSTGGSWPGAMDCYSGTGWALVSKWWVVVLSITYFSWVLFPSLFFSLQLLLFYILLLFLITELFLSQPLVYLFLIPFSIPPRGSEQMPVWYLVADCGWLNHGSPLQEEIVQRTSVWLL